MDPSISDESDGPLTPNRSPSRLDFCMDSLEQADDPPAHGMDWACTSFRDSCPYTFIDEDAFTVDIAPLDHSPLPIVDPPQATDPPTHENADTSHAPPMPPEHPTVVIEPQAPIPVRPPSVQLQVDAQEFTPAPRNAAQRHNYPHHGFSRSALLQQKTLWNSRHEEWAEWQSRMEQGDAQKQEPMRNDAYTGLAAAQPRIVENPPPYMRTPPSGLERDLVDLPPKEHEQDVHSSIYPRVGDISALRDPYSVNIDRCFFRYPLWTLHKTLYVFNMHQRTVPLAPSASPYNTAEVQVSTSLSTLSSYSSSTSGDDEESDSTLVTDDSPVPNGQRRLSEPSKSASSPYSPHQWDHLRGWELSWYARWELLIGLFQRNQTRCDAFEMSMKLVAPFESKAGPPLLSAPIFRFAIGDDEDNDDDDDDDDDYGTLIINSSFRVDFEEECERAMAFYSRDSKCLGMGL